MAVIGPVSLRADTLTNWTGGNGNWTDPTWDNGNPVNGYRAFINNGGTVTINTAGAACSRFYLGIASDYATAGSGYMVMNGRHPRHVWRRRICRLRCRHTGGFTLNSGTITAADGCQLEVGSWGGTGTFTQNGGTINNMDAAGGGINGDEAFILGPMAMAPTTWSAAR